MTAKPTTQPPPTPAEDRQAAKARRFAEWESSFGAWGLHRFELLFARVLKRHRVRGRVNVRRQEVEDLYEFAASKGRLAAFERELDALEKLSR